MGYQGGQDDAEGDESCHAERLLCTKPQARCCGYSDNHRSQSEFRDGATSHER